MMATAPDGAMLVDADGPTLLLVRVAATLAAGQDEQVRAMLQQAARGVSHEWIEELLLQTYLFAGFPRALNGMREWRRLVATPVAVARPVGDVRRSGERTCARVYGRMYDRLRANIRALHPLFDDWMIDEGYGKVLSRPGLDLPRRELCIVAACAATGQDRQLQSHLHGARNVGASETAVTLALESLDGVIPDALRDRALRLWDRIRHDVH